MKHRILTIVACIAAILLTITVSIGMPIYFRPFYYLQIDNLRLVEETGYTKEELCHAYDQVMDYLTLPGQEFGTGVFPHSAAGIAHFEDCKILFDLNSAVLLLSALTVVVLYLMRRRGIFLPCRPFRKHYTFLCGIGTLVLFGLAGGLAATDFSRAFVIFHRLFFPGKENWLFRVSEDPIILALPEAFFLRCGILIISSILVLSLAMILNATISSKKRRDSHVGRSTQAVR